MSGATIDCVNGHPNPAAQKHCGECGVSLAGFCPNGHQNPDGQRFCGECGSQLGQIGNAKSDTVSTADVETAGEASSPSVNQHTEASQLANSQGSSSTEGGATQATLNVGDQLMLPDSIYATVVKFDDDNVWLNLTKGASSFGISKYPRRDVEKSLVERRIAVVDHSAAPSGAQPSLGSVGGIFSAQPPHSPAGPAQLNQTVTANVFSVIAFVLAGLALFGGVTLVALPTIFGVAGIICAVVGLTKKERLAPYAIGAAVGGLILGWLLQAVVFNAVFS